MKEIIFYTNKNGVSEIKNYLKILQLKNDKDSRINTGKIYAYIENLASKGVSIGEPYVKYLGFKIWELRPLRHRILFFELDNKYILLTHFIKETSKTPKEEISKARKYMKDYLCREETNEQEEK